MPDVTPEHRPPAAGAPEGIPSPARLERLRRRRDFLRVAAARNKFVTPGMVVQAAPRPSGDDAIGVGFTVTRKVGSAVVRNRARRRLREIARQHLPLCGQPGTDYVLIGRGATVSRPFARLASDLARALSALHRRRRQGGTSA
ncbi:MAG: ribonuclease P protein component [Alphaproteobacteria bacterium]|nr:MAG: ribonuclease P protein component [Alphaproteobacteria bacterium]